MLTTILVSTILLTQQEFRKDFNVPAERFQTTGRSTYFILEPGFKLVFRGKENGGTTALIITVLDRTETIDGTKTRIVEERESHNGKLVEVSRNFFAMDSQNNDVYYFGEDVDMYKNGKVVNHEGSWRSGMDGAHYGLFMSGHPKVGDAYFQEQAPGNALDQVTHTSVTKTVKTPAKTFKNCLVIKETTPLEPGVVAWKTFAPGVGIIVDGNLRLTSYTGGK